MPYAVKRFRFRLQALLNIERNREKQAQIAFQRAASKLQREQAVLAQQEAEFKTEQAAMAAAIRRGASPHELSAYELFFAGLEKQMEAQRDRIKEAETALESARKEMIQRTKQRKILEKLKERAKEAYDEEVRHIEVNLLDEVGTTMIIQKSKE